MLLRLIEFTASSAKKEKKISRGSKEGAAEIISYLNGELNEFIRVTR